MPPSFPAPKQAVLCRVFSALMLLRDCVGRHCSNFNQMVQKCFVFWYARLYILFYYFFNFFILFCHLVPHPRGCNYLQANRIKTPQKAAQWILQTTEKTTAYFPASFFDFLLLPVFTFFHVFLPSCVKWYRETSPQQPAQTRGLSHKHQAEIPLCTSAVAGGEGGSKVLQKS